MTRTMSLLLLVGACSLESESQIPRAAPPYSTERWIAEDARCCTAAPVQGDPDTCVLPYVGQHACNGEARSCNTWVATSDSSPAAQASWECRETSPVTTNAVTSNPS